MSNPENREIVLEELYVCDRHEASKMFALVDDFEIMCWIVCVIYTIPKHL